MMKDGLSVNACFLWVSFLLTRLFFLPFLLFVYSSDVAHILQFKDSSKMIAKDIIPYTDIDSFFCFLLGPFSLILLITINLVWFKKVHRKVSSILSLHWFSDERACRLYTDSNNHKSCKEDQPLQPPPPSPIIILAQDGIHQEEEEDIQEEGSDEVQYDEEDTDSDRKDKHDPILMEYEKEKDETLKKEE